LTRFSEAVNIGILNFCPLIGSSIATIPRHQMLSVKQLISKIIYSWKETSPYSPDFSPNGILLLPQLTSTLKGQKSQDIDDIVGKKLQS
jgi:hypothetical protein